MNLSATPLVKVVNPWRGIGRERIGGLEQDVFSIRARRRKEEGRRRPSEVDGSESPRAVIAQVKIVCVWSCAWRQRRAALRVDDRVLHVRREVQEVRNGRGSRRKQGW